MEDASVGERMSAPVLTIEPDVPLDDAAGTMLDGGINSVVVIDDDCRPTGILTSTDLVRAAADGLSPGGTTVGEQMTEGEIVSIGPDAEIATAAARMAEREIDHLPVVDGGKAVGIVTTTDLAVYLGGARERAE